MAHQLTITDTDDEEVNNEGSKPTDHTVGYRRYN